MVTVDFVVLGDEPKAEAPTGLALITQASLRTHEGHTGISHHDVAEAMDIRADHLARLCKRLREQNPQAFGTLPSAGEGSEGKLGYRKHYILNEPQIVMALTASDSPAPKIAEFRAHVADVFVTVKAAVRNEPLPTAPYPPQTNHLPLLATASAEPRSEVERPSVRLRGQTLCRGNQIIWDC
ncbi:MAG: hypothetical protein JWN04_1207 [Myxococcaceae bacterium]|nr:hypothetical protein [Myxococcaceae bacterium]